MEVGFFDDGFRMQLGTMQSALLVACERPCLASMLVHQLSFFS